MAAASVPDASVCRPPDHHPQGALPKLADPTGAIDAAFERPVGSAPLAELASGRRSACILICDITRPVPNRLFLRPMIQTMMAAGIPLGRIRCWSRPGLHRPNLGEELAELVGDPWVLETRARSRTTTRATRPTHVDLGRTPTRGTPVKLDRRFVEADLRIATGLVEPHFMAGWSGGRKVVAPGVAHHETIRTFHSARFMEDPLAVQCNLIGNPLARGAARDRPHAGRRLRAQHGARRGARPRLRRPSARSSPAIRRRSISSPRRPMCRCRGEFSTVVTSSAGYPLDKTYYQTIKGMVTPLDILEPGGTLIIASECSEGFGSAEFRAGAGAAGGTRPRAVPGDADRQEPRRSRRMADGDAAEAHAAWAASSCTPPASPARTGG